MVMTRAGPVDLTPQELDTIAWEFLASEFAGQTYTNWSIDRRIYAYLLRHGLIAVANDGSAYHAVLECVMANIGQAQRNGTLPPPATQEPVEQRASGA